MLLEKLQQQLASIEALQLTLEAETACLKEKNFAQLNAILFNKKKSLQEIAFLDKAFSGAAPQQTIKTDNELLSLKNKIDSQLLTCQKINNINGRLVELSMKSNKHLMQLIKQETGKNSVTYDQKGMLNSASLLGRNIKA